MVVEASARRERNQNAPGQVLVLSFGQPVAVDYVNYVCRRHQGSVSFVGNGVDAAAMDARVCCHPLDHVTPPVLGSDLTVGSAALILFIPPVWSHRDRRVLETYLDSVTDSHLEFVGIISTFRVDLDDEVAAASEAYAVRRVQKWSTRTRVFRPGHILSRHSPTSAKLRQLGWLYPLVPSWLRGCCIDGHDLFAAIESERVGGGPPGLRSFTFLGPCIRWRALLKANRPRNLLSACLTALSGLFAILPIGPLTAILLELCASRRPFWRSLSMRILRPRSLRELLVLYNKYNYRYVKVVGYNNGINHFGHRYPEKTIVSTVLCNRVVRAGPDLLKADCGTTVRQALDFLGSAGYELPVVPNFSYVCLGTAFFVPIHGSAADISTIGETIVRVVLYDPLTDRLLRATRDDLAFHNYAYNMKAHVLLLRVLLRIKPKERYSIHREVIVNPAAPDLIRALKDTSAANVEIRKARASSNKAVVCRYYTDSKSAGVPALALPRDALGRLWDRLEENRLTSFLMHALTRYFAWHVELFFSEPEFAVFWQSHHTLPLRKIQIRYIRRDGLRHSPFCENDCVSVDLFMLRRQRYRFDRFLRASFVVVRANPGKHSR